METSNECPFCGANSIKKLPISDRVKKIGGGAAGAAGPTSGSC